MAGCSPVLGLRTTRQQETSVFHTGDVVTSGLHHPLSLTTGYLGAVAEAAGHAVQGLLPAGFLLQLTSVFAPTSRLARRRATLFQGEDSMGSLEAFLRQPLLHTMLLTELGHA